MKTPSGGLRFEVFFGISLALLAILASGFNSWNGTGLMPA
jgi:hypothetical protein